MSHGDLSKHVVAPRSTFYQGPFGRICGDLPPASYPVSTEPELDELFFTFANDEMVELGPPTVDPGDIADDSALRAQEAGFESAVPAGYTYFGQFIDHDITFDPASSLVRMNDPDRLLNFRTPRLDLDNLYGRGPAEQPYLYDGASAKGAEKFAIGTIGDTGLPDLPRSAAGVALIGDKRNDENAIVSQLQLAFLLAHNTLVDRAVAQGVAHPFQAARTTLRWLYQWIVWHDFLGRITDDAIRGLALELKHGPGGSSWERGLDGVYNWRDQPFMPVEFSVAAYRFGHSMVRNSYQTNNDERGFNRFAAIFDNSGTGDPDDLRGFRPMKVENVIQWDWFLQMSSSAPGLFPQRAHLIDTKLANALAFLHEGPAGARNNVLAFLNLKRGWSFELPSGAAVAAKFGLDEVPLADGEPESLWYYVLKEAETTKAGESLGAVGSTIVCATFAGLLAGDPSSFVNVHPRWTPDDDVLLAGSGFNSDTADGSWTLPAVIRMSGLPVRNGDLDALRAGSEPVPV